MSPVRNAKNVEMSSLEGSQCGKRSKSLKELQTHIRSNEKTYPYYPYNENKNAVDTNMMSSGVTDTVYPDRMQRNKPTTFEVQPLLRKGIKTECTETGLRNITEAQNLSLCKEFRGIKVNARLGNNRCEICSLRFLYRASLVRHVKKEHGSNNSSSEEAQLSTTIGGKNLNILKNWHNCAVCSKTFISYREFKLHIKNEHTSWSDVSCLQCGKTLNSYRMFSDHMKCHNKQFQCDQCSRQFPRNYLLMRHAERNHGVCTSATSYSCMDCDKCFAFKSSLVAHSKSHSSTNTKPHMCNICGKCFTQKLTLTGHMYIHTGEKPFKCQFCDQAFRQSTDLTNHTRALHTGIKPYVCNLCGKDFIRGTILKYHMRTHTGERPLCCNTCGKRFHNPINLREHMKSHSNEKLFPCTLCVAQFKKKSGLQRHMRTHAEEPSYICKVCGNGFNQSGNLKTHMRTHTQERPYKCSICEMSFPHHGTWKKHEEGHQHL